MSIRVTENWSGLRLSQSPPWEADREFLVTGTSDQMAALSHDDIPQRGDGHDANPVRLRCDGPKIKEVRGPFSFVIGCHYSLDIGAYTDENPDPLLIPPRITWSTIREIAESDHDLDNKAIINAAGDLMRGPLPFTYKHLRIIKNVPYYDIGLSAAFECGVNKDPLTIQGIAIDAEHMYCCQIEPAVQDYQDGGSPFIPVAFDFDVIANNVRGKYPFQGRFLNSGRNGWFNDPVSGKLTPGRFCNAAGDQLIDFDVKLDIGGAPLAKPYGAATIMVGSGNNGAKYSPVAINTAAQPYKKEFYKGDGTLETTTTGTADTEAVFFYYKFAHIRDFADLLALFASS